MYGRPPRNGSCFGHFAPTPKLLPWSLPTAALPLPAEQACACRRPGMRVRGKPLPGATFGFQQLLFSP